MTAKINPHAEEVECVRAVHAVSTTRRAGQGPHSVTIHTVPVGDRLGADDPLVSYYPDHFAPVEAA